MEPEIYVMRHGQSRFNAGIGDELDSNLSPEGEKQAKQLKGQYDLVITSPLRRAIDTLLLSEIKYKHHLVYDNCREWRNVSLCDYLDGEKIIMETEEQVGIRTEALVDLLRGLQKVFPRILVVSHGGFLRKLTNGIHFHQNCQLQKVYIPN